MSSASRQKMRNLRCTNRQVTKRSFHLHSSEPSPRRAVQPRRAAEPSSGSSDSDLSHTSSLGSSIRSQSSKQTLTRVSPIAAYVIKDVFKVPRNRSHQDVAELSCSSPLALITEHDENACPDSPTSDDTGDTDAGEPSQTSTENMPVSQRKSRPQPLHVPPEETPPPGDVSVSFLASTPKPGRPQFSRRRQFSATREVQRPRSTLSDRSRNPLGTSIGSVSRSATRTKKLSQSQQKLHHGKQHPRPVFRDLSSKSKNVIHQQTEPSETVSSDQSELATSEVSDTSHNTTRSSKRIANKKIIRGPAQNQSKETVEEGSGKRGRKRARDENLSEESSMDVEDVGTRKLRRQAVAHVEPVGKTAKSKQSASVVSKLTGLRETSSLTNRKEKQKKSTEASDAKSTQSRRKPKRISAAQDSTSNVSSEDDSRVSQHNQVETATQYDISSSDENSHSVAATRKRLKTSTSLNKRKKVSACRDSDLEVEVGNPIKKRVRSMSFVGFTDVKGNKSGQNVTICDIDGVKRLKNDIVHMDVVLNDFTDIITSEMSNCVSQKEETAVKLLEKYLVQDITSMIKDVYTVKTLQARVKKMNQRVTLRKEELLELQTQRMELEDKSTLEQNEEVSENMTRINQCLADLKTLVDIC